MYTIGKLFHLTHVVDDLSAVDRWYDEVFSVERFYSGYEELAGRNASLLAIGELIMEPMEPARVANLRNQSVKKFHDRFGQHLHSIAWYIDNVEALSQQLSRHGLRQFDIVGRQVRAEKIPPAFWTHPRETCGQLEFAKQTDAWKDPRLRAGWSSAKWRDQHPLRIERTSHITAVTGDLARAQHLYCDVIGGRLLHQTETPQRRNAFISIGTDTVVELTQPLSSSTDEARELERNGEGQFAFTFKTSNLTGAAEFLKSKGLAPVAQGPNSIALPPEQAFGMVVGFTDRSIPNDPRK